MNTFHSIASIIAIVAGLLTASVTLYKFFTGKVNFKDKVDPLIAQKRKTYWVPLVIAAGALIVVIVALFFILPRGLFTTSNKVYTSTNKVVDRVEKKSPDVIPPVVEKPPNDKTTPTSTANDPVKSTPPK